jgi:hypothetical protein
MALGLLRSDLSYHNGSPCLAVHLKAEDLGRSAYCSSNASVSHEKKENVESVSVLVVCVKLEMSL